MQFSSNEPNTTTTKKRRRSLSKVTIDFKNILELVLDFAVNLRLHAFALNFLFIASPSLVKTKKIILDFRK